MATSGILGLLFETDSAPPKVQQALQAFEASTATHCGNIEAQFDELQEKSGDALKSLENHLIVTAGSFARLEHQLPMIGQEAARFGGEVEHAGPGTGERSGLPPGSIPDLASAMGQGSKRLEELSAPSASNLMQNMLVEFEATQKSTQAHQAATKAVKDHQTAITALAEHVPMLSKRVHAELLPSLAELDAGAGSISQRLDDQLAPSFRQSGEAARTFGDTASGALIRATQASSGAVAAESARLTATLGFRRIAAGIEAAWETAKGIASLAEWDFRGAALHFMSAAEYGIIAGASGHRAHGGGAGAGYGGREPHFLGTRDSGVGSRESRMVSGQARTTVVFNVSGHLITGPETAEWMAGQLTDFVQNRDGHLVSSHTKDSTLTRDSLNG